ncbi:MAG: hypothetical protein NZ695_04675 [Dehalococcoidia bacterium]|mgnify:CR=1 FL=1|nr:hypothetical protein [Dehalococcoidia bacterium]MDW8008572.1 hypothetical protein [Chloroflexota bacterium]
MRGMAWLGIGGAVAGAALAAALLVLAAWLEGGYGGGTLVGAGLWTFFLMLIVLLPITVSLAREGAKGHKMESG